MLYLVDAGTQERHVLQSLLVALLQSTPDAGAFDVDADIVDLGMHARQPDGIFALATAQLQHDGVIVMEKLLVPLALQREALAHDAFVTVFEQVGEGLVFALA